MAIKIGKKFQMNGKEYEVIQKFGGQYGVLPTRRGQKKHGWQVLSQAQLENVVKPPK